MIQKSAFLGLLAILLTTAFAEGNPDRVYTFRQWQMPLHDLEVVPADEINAIEETGQAFGEFFKRKYEPSGTAPYISAGAVPRMTGSLRGVHPKAHGCLTGTMKVSNHLEEIDQVGIFKAPGKEYKVMARFSNGSPHPEQPDAAPDARGFGLKVFGVEGEPLLKGIAGGARGTQEFTINSSNAFFADTASNYNRFMQIGLLQTTDFEVAAKKFVLGLLADFQPALAYRVGRAFQGIKAVETTNPLAIQYFSISAFQHGPGNHAPIVKYSVVPCNGTWIDPVDKTNPNFLKENLKRHMGQSSACFYFMVQHRTNPSLSVEDPTQPWDETVAPFRILAEINFPKQHLMDEMVCEKEVINPWNTLPEHKPVGGINRMRLGAYLLSIEARKKSNQY